jgi:membrane fusion protein, heavy metal efflux system
MSRYILILLVAFSVTAHAEEEGHDEEHEGGIIEMSAQQRSAQGIETAKVESRTLTAVVNAPGEVAINLYRSAQVTPRITAQVISRNAYLGDQVKKDQKLVTLSSVAMAEAQGALVETDREWKRVKKLGRKVVSEKRYVSAQVARQRAYATVLAYGMSKKEVTQLLNDGDASRATGEFDLLSPQKGTIIFDKFVLGEVVEAGRLLFEVSDESVVWVEAKLRPEQAVNIQVGSLARISADGKNWSEGKVVQLHHRLDAGSRTLGVRIEVSEEIDLLHPGEYVQVALETSASEKRIAVPEAAVVLMQGSPSVFKLDGDKLSAYPVEVGINSAGWLEITAGLTEGEEIATKGVFILKSLVLKSQIGDDH